MSTETTAASALAAIESILEREKQKLQKINQAIAQIAQCPPHKRSLSALQVAALLLNQDDLPLNVSDSEAEEEKVATKRTKHATEDDIPLVQQLPSKPRSYLYESIVAATKDHRGTVLYLVKWADYPLDEASFEPASCFGQGKGSGLAFEVLFLRNVFSMWHYKFLSTDLCKSTSGWKRGPAAPQMKDPQNIDALTHFEFSYQDVKDVQFKICDPLVWPSWFKGSDWQLKICLPLKRFHSSIQEEEEKDPDFEP